MEVEAVSVGSIHSAHGTNTSKRKTGGKKKASSMDDEEYQPKGMGRKGRQKQEASYVASDEELEVVEAGTTPNSSQVQEFHDLVHGDSSSDEAPLNVCKMMDEVRTESYSTLNSKRDRSTHRTSSTDDDWGPPKVQARPKVGNVLKQPKILKFTKANGPYE